MLDFPVPFGPRMHVKDSLSGPMVWRPSKLLKLERESTVTQRTGENDAARLLGTLSDTRGSSAPTARNNETAVKMKVLPTFPLRCGGETPSPSPPLFFFQREKEDVTGDI